MPMKVVYSLGEIDPSVPSIFLAGPTPRNSEIKWWERFFLLKRNVPTWRKEALEILAAMNFDGIVYVPEDDGWTMRDGFDTDEQRRWEREAIRASSVTLFWVPRELKTMPAFTTNVEFGWVHGDKSLKYVLGSPAKARKMGYLIGVSQDERPEAPIRQTLRETLAAAVQIARNG